MELITPCNKYQTSYIQYIQELGDEERYPFPLDFDYQDFQALLARLDEFANGINLPEGYVPSTTLWLVENNELIGVTNLRHFLNENIKHCGGHIGLGIRPSYRGKGMGNLLMKLSIEKLFDMNVNELHIHCYKQNLASAKAIKTNGGILHSELHLSSSKDEAHIVQRYLVSTS